jgi:hypothetical protein
MFTVSMVNQGPAPAIGPSGSIVISDGAGHSCNASAWNAVIAGQASCPITFPNAGSVNLTATYAGDTTWGSASTTGGAYLDKQTPTIDGGVSDETPYTNEPTTLSWDVSGPTTGTVSQALTSGLTCSSSALTGSCPLTYPLSTDGVAQPIAVTYPGDANWNPVSLTATVTPLGCYTLRLDPSPTNGGSITTNPAPFCNGGTGFPRGYLVGVDAVPASGYRVDHLSPLKGYGTSAVVTVGPYTTGGTTYVWASFTPLVTCYTISYDTELVQGAKGYFSPREQPNCTVDANGFNHAGPGTWQPAQGYWGTPKTALQGSFLAGTTLHFNADTAYGDTVNRLYGYRIGWRGAAVTSSTGQLPPVTVTDNAAYIAVFGPTCAHLSASADGGGSVSVDTKSDCQDPDGAGFLRTTSVTVTASISGDGAFINGWTVDGAARAANPTPTYAYGPPPAYTRTTTSTDTVTLGFDTTTLHSVVAHFSSCKGLTIGYTGAGDGTVTSTPAAGNCPTRKDVLPDPNDHSIWASKASRTLYFTPSTQVSLVADGTSDKTNQLLNVFDNWGTDIPTVRNQWGDSTQTASVTMDRDHSVNAFFYPLKGCNVLWVNVQPVGAGSVEVDGDNYQCPLGDLAKPVTSRSSGKFLGDGGGDFGFHAVPAHGNPEMGYTLPHGQQYSQDYVEYSVPGQDTSVNLRYDGQVTASFCERLNTNLTLVSPNGTRHYGSLPDGSDMIMVNPAPNCPFDDAAWLVNTQVEVAALGDPTGFQFQGWSGASSAGTFVTDVTLDGASNSVSINATYNVICHTLTVNPNDRITRSNAPTCPDEPASANKYVGGGTITLAGDVHSDEVFQGWSGDVGRTDEGITWVIMDGDKTANLNFRGKTTGEKISDGFTWFGNQVAVTAKKAVAAVALVGEALINNVPPLGIVQAMVALSQGVDTLLGFAGVNLGITQYLLYAQQTVNWLTSSLTCASVWGFSSSSSSGTATTGNNNLVVTGNATANSLSWVHDTKEAAQELKDAQAARTWEQVGSTSGGMNQAALELNETTGAIDKAKIGFSKVKTGIFGVGTVAAVAQTGYDVYNIVQAGPGFGWDSSATSAWTNGDAFESCSKSMVPGYVADAMAKEAPY